MNPGLQRGWKGLLDKMAGVMSQIAEDEDGILSDGLNMQLDELRYGLETYLELVEFLRALPDDGGTLLWLTEQGPKQSANPTDTDAAARLRDGLRGLGSLLGESVAESAAALRYSLSYMVNVNVDPTHWGPKLQGAYEPMVNPRVVAFRIRRARATLAFLYASCALSVQRESVDATDPHTGPLDALVPSESESLLDAIRETETEQLRFLKWHRDVTKTGVEEPLVSLAFRKRFASLDQMSREEARRAQDLANTVIMSNDAHASLYRRHIEKVASIAKSAGAKAFRFAP